MRPNYFEFLKKREIRGLFKVRVEEHPNFWIGIPVHTCLVRASLSRWTSFPEISDKGSDYRKFSPFPAIFPNKQAYILCTLLLLLLLLCDFLYFFHAFTSSSAIQATTVFQKSENTHLTELSSSELYRSLRNVRRRLRGVWRYLQRSLWMGVVIDALLSVGCLLFEWSLQ